MRLDLVFNCRVNSNTDQTGNRASMLATIAVELLLSLAKNYSSAPPIQLIDNLPLLELTLATERILKLAEDSAGVNPQQGLAFKISPTLKTHAIQKIEQAFKDKTIFATRGRAYIAYAFSRLASLESCETHLTALTQADTGLLNFIDELASQPDEIMPLAPFVDLFSKPRDFINRVCSINESRLKSYQLMLKGISEERINEIERRHLKAQEGKL